MTPARKLYLDNIRWMTVVLVVIYHVVYMFNGVQPFGVIGPFGLDFVKRFSVIFLNSSGCLQGSPV